MCENELYEAGYMMYEKMELRIFTNLDTNVKTLYIYECTKSDGIKP